MTTPDPTRSKAIEVMARAMCAADGFVWENQFSHMTSANGDDSPESYLHAAAAALTAYESHLQAEGMAVVPGWQPIESAPRDGTRIILAWGGAAVTGFYLDNGHTAYPWKGWRVPSLELTPPGAPSAWMPFPEVPAHVS